MVQINIQRDWLDKPSSVKAAENPSLGMRINWIFHSLVLFAQAKYLLGLGLDSGAIGAYAAVAVIFGAVAMITAVFSKIPWNKK